MKLEVLIHRQTKLEPSEGTLKAWVVQEGQRGPQLLTGRFVGVEAAKQAIEKRLLAKIPPPGCTIEWTIEDYQDEPKYAAPVKPTERHPFYVIEGNRFCGTCGGGILHPIHQAPQESAPSPKV